MSSLRGFPLPDTPPGVLADRLAAALVHHEPGWRLPRPSALARRYDVRPALVEGAIRELAARHLIRQLPDGQLYRASPAEFLIPVQGVPRLGAHVDPMGSEVTLRNRKVSWRRAPEDIGLALGVTATGSVCTVKCHWLINGDSAAISITYLTQIAANRLGDIAEADRIPVTDLLSSAVDGKDKRSLLGFPAALHLEMQPPPSSLAHGLRLGAGQPAVMVTIRYDDLALGKPVALTMTALRADLFRILVDSGGQGWHGKPVTLNDALADDVQGDQISCDSWQVQGRPEVGR